MYVIQFLCDLDGRRTSPKPLSKSHNRLEVFRIHRPKEVIGYTDDQVMISPVRTRSATKNKEENKK